MSSHIVESEGDSQPDWNEELIQAVRQPQGTLNPISEENRLKRMRECLMEEAEIDTVDKHGNTALHIAVKKSYLKLVQFLGDQRAKTDIRNRKGDTALTLAETPGKQDILNILKGLASSSQTTSSSDQRAKDDKRTLVNLKRHATAYKENNKNCKTRRFCDTGEKEEQFSSRKNSQSDDDTVDEGSGICQQSLWVDRNDKYTASGLKDTLHGNIYQLKLLMLFLIRGLLKDYSFSLATEMTAAEKFDDLVFKYVDEGRNKTVYRFLQAKHKQNETKKISSRDLLNETDGDFSLQKYFVSYSKIKRNPVFNGSDFKDFIVCTNIHFDLESLKTAGIGIRDVKESDDVLDFKNLTKQSARYKFHVDEQSELFEILRRSAEVFKLANILVKHVCEEKKLELRHDLFKLYHTALATEVIDVENNKFFSNFINGEQLSVRGNNFRKIFCAEALKQLTRLFKKNMTKEAVWKVIPNISLNMSSSFGEKFGISNNPVLNPLRDFSNELVKLINSADDKNLVRIDGRKYGKKATPGTREKVFVDNIDKLAGHVLIMEDKEIKFSSQFLDDNIRMPGNLDGLKDLMKTQLRSKYNDLGRYRFDINNFKTCEEGQQYSKTELPGDNIDDEEIVEFFDKLIFAVNQPNEEELGNIIKQDIANRFNSRNADLVGDSFLIEMLDWMKKKLQKAGGEGRFYSVENGQAFFDSAERKVITFMCSSLSLLYSKELEEYGVSFENEIETLTNYLIADSWHGVKSTLNLVAARETLPSAIRVHQAILQTGRYTEKDSFLFLHRKTLMTSDIEELVVRAFRSPDSHHLLVIDCDSVERQVLQGLYNRLCKSMTKNKKLILITQGVGIENCIKINHDVNFSDLTKESRLKLIRRQGVMFQGKRRSTSFQGLLGNLSSDYVIDRSTLLKLIRDEEIKVGHDLQELGEIEKYYIHRTINRHDIETSSRYWELRNRGTDKVTSSLTEDQLADCNEGQKVVIIADSAGMGKTTVFTCLAKKIKEKNPDLWVIRINLNDFNQVLSKELGNRREKNSNYVNEPVDFFVNEFSNLKNDSEKEILRSMINQSRVVLLFDGFDEICPSYKDIVVGLLQVFNEIGVAKLFVATRPHMCEMLEKKLQMSPYNMEPFSEDDQIDFMVRFWKAGLKLNDVEQGTEQRLRTYAKAFIKKMNESIDYRSTKLTSTPLQVQMIAEVFQDDSEGIVGIEGVETCRQFLVSENEEPNLRGKLNIVRLYRSFVDKKYHIYRTEKNKCDPTNLGVQENSLALYDIFFKKHQILALHALHGFGRPAKTYELDILPVLLNQQEMKLIKVYTNEINEGQERTGIITQVIGGKSQFIHRTFAEYFVATLLIEKFLEEAHDNEKLQTLFITYIFDDPFIAVSRAFLNHLLLDKSAHASANETWKVDLCGPEFHRASFRALENLVNEGNHEIVKFLLNRFDNQDETVKNLINDKHLFGRTLLHCVCGVSSHTVTLGKTNSAPALCDVLEIVKFLVDKGASVNEPDSIGRTPLHVAAESGKLSVLKWLVDEKEGDIDYRSKIGETVLHYACQWDIVEWLSTKKNFDINSKNVYGMTILHYTVFRNDLVFLERLVENGANVNGTFSGSVSVLHVAVARKKWELVKWLVEHGADVNEKYVNILPKPKSYSHLCLFDANDYIESLHMQISELWKSKCGLNYDDQDFLIVGEWDTAQRQIREKQRNVNIIHADNKTVVHYAALFQQWDLVMWLLRDVRTDVNIQDSSGSTVLHCAAFSGNLNLVEWLVKERGADIRIKTNTGMTLLHYAAASGEIHLVEWLLGKNIAHIDATSNQGTTMLHEAGLHGRWDLVKWLVDKGADVRAKSNSGCTVLHIAAYRQQWDVITVLLESNAAPDPQLLPYVIQHRTLEQIKSAINSKVIDVNTTLENGMGILHYAVTFGRVEVIRWLVADMGADLRTVDAEGKTLLHLAAAAGQLDVLKWLVEERATNVKSVDKAGRTLLHAAMEAALAAETVYAGNSTYVSVISDMIRLIVESYEVDINATDDDKYTALDLYCINRDYSPIDPNDYFNDTDLDAFIHKSFSHSDKYVCRYFDPRISNVFCDF